MEQKTPTCSYFRNTNNIGWDNIMSRKLNKKSSGIPSGPKKKKHHTEKITLCKYLQLRNNTGSRMSDEEEIV